MPDNLPSFIIDQLKKFSKDYPKIIPEFYHITLNAYDIYSKFNERIIESDYVRINLVAHPYIFNNSKITKNSNTYASYSAWFINRFCKPCLIDQDAKQKREMLSATLGLDNYLLHLDYIDRQILLEQFDGDINKRIDEIVSKNKDFDNEITNDSTKVEFRKDIKDMELELNNQGENNLNKHLNSKE